MNRFLYTLSIFGKTEHLKPFRETYLIASKISGRNKLSIALDMIYSRLKYQVCLEEYLVFGFALVEKKYWKHYLNTRMVHRLNAKFNRLNIENKWSTYLQFKPYFKRDMVHLEKSSVEEIEAFLAKHTEFFAKAEVSYGGLDVEHVHVVEEDKTVLTERLKSKGLVILEEVIRQHEALTKIAPASVNTLRVVTALSNSGELIFLPTLIRFGNGTASVDNVSSGGVYTLLDAEGVVRLKGFFQDNSYIAIKEGQVIEKHPFSQVAPYGLELPYYKETMEMVGEMARSVPEMQLIGWDIAITPDGPCLVELNDAPGIDMNQNYCYRDIFGKEHVGLKEIMEKHFSIEL